MQTALRQIAFIARHDLALERAQNALSQARKTGFLIGFAVGVLHPEGRRGDAIGGGVSARVDDIGAGQRKRAGQAREDAGVVGHNKAGAGGIAVLVGVQVHANFVFGNPAQQVCKNHVGGDVKTLPIGVVVPSGFDL